jgi:hypothetical protein
VKNRLITAAALAVLTAGATTAAAIAFDSTPSSTTASEPPSVARIQESPAADPSAAARSAERIGVGGQPRLIGERAGRAFYRLEKPSGQTCYASGNAATATTETLGVVACPAAFPTAAEPIIDLSLYDIDRSGTVKPVRFEGIAADSIHAVALVAPGGVTVALAPVAGGIYSFGAVPYTAVGELVAVDATGKIVFRDSFARGRG